MMRGTRYLALALLVGMFFGCNEPIPDADVQAAKQAIAQAESAKADKYDPDNLSKAKDAYRDSLKRIADSDTGNAREAALDAKRIADLATDNARKKVAEDTTASAERMIQEAIVKKAEYLAADDLARARAKLEDAKKGIADGKWLEAYTDAENSLEAAGRAKDNAVRKMSELAKAVADAEDAVRRADANEVVREFAKTELDAAKLSLQKTGEEKKKVDDPTTIQADSADTRNRLAATAYADAMKLAHETVNKANDAVRIALEREREFYKKKAEQKMDEAKKLLEDIRKLKEQGLIKQQVIPAPVVPEGETVSQTNIGMTNLTSLSNMSNLDKYNAALEALKKAEETYTNENFVTSVRNSEEAIRIAKLVKETGKTPPDELKYYTVLIPEARDCLWRIAGYPFVYGDPRLWPKIWKANKHLIVDPDLIYPDQKFVIPAKK